MADQKDGGPAFPGVIRWPDGCKDRTETFDGMSLRDWFAGQALAGMLANPTVKSWDENDESPEQLAAVYALMAFKFADAMLAERDWRREEFMR